MKKFIFTLFVTFISLSILSACSEDGPAFEDLYQIKKDTIVKTDTTFHTDTIIKKDSITNKTDTIIIVDTIVKKDTVLTEDTIIYPNIISPSDTVPHFKITISPFIDTGFFNGCQGAACYGKYLFQFIHANISLHVYDMETKSRIGIFDQERNDNYHCNNASFSNIFYDKNDEFPLVYVSGSQVSTYNHVQVYRIKNTGNNFILEHVQEITLPQSNENNHLYWTSVTLDDNGYMYVLAGHNGGQIAKFRIPDINKQDVTIHYNEVVDHFTIPNFICLQGACYKDQMLYIADGGSNTKRSLRIIDLKNKREYQKIELKIAWEPEGMVFYGDQLILTTGAGFYVLNLERIDNNE